MILNFTKKILTQKITIPRGNSFRSILIFVMIGLGTLNIGAQSITWTGAVDSDWENPANWSTNMVPTITDFVIIPDANPLSSPVITTEVETASVSIDSGGEINISPTGELIAGNPTTAAIINNGLIINSGLLRMNRLGPTAPVIFSGIVNNGTLEITPDGEIDLSQVGVLGDPNSVNILNNGQITNEGEITILSILSTGLEINNNGVFYNNNVFNIQDFASAPTNVTPILITDGTFNNGISSFVNVTGNYNGIEIGTNGILNNMNCSTFESTVDLINAGTITNDGSLTLNLTAPGNAPIDPIINTGSFTSNAGSILTLPISGLAPGSNPIINNGVNLNDFLSVEFPQPTTPGVYSPAINFDPSNFLIEFYNSAFDLFFGAPTAGVFDPSTNTFIANDPNQTNFFIRVENVACIGPGVSILQPYNIEIVADVDSDMDGIFDSSDLCSDTPAGEVVNNDGCACSQLTVDDSDPCTEDVCVDGVVTNTFLDADGDGTCDANDDCPNDPNKIALGTCGCDVSDEDLDLDGIADCNDLCLNTPTGEPTNADGCACSQLTVDDSDPCTEDVCVDGVVTNTFLDADGDGTCDANDNCPNDPNKIALGTCGCDVSDEDLDLDGIADCNDLCLNTPAGETTNADGCACSQLTVDDSDPCTEDVCVDGVVTNTFLDADGDGTCDANDDCPNDPNKITPGVCGCGVEDIDSNGDGIFDCEDTSIYCMATGVSTQYEWIKKVGVNDELYFTGDNGGYADFTSTSFPLEAGSSNTMTLIPGFSGNNYFEYWTVYIDLNQDGDFYDPGELVLNQVSGYGFIKAFTIPNTAMLGTTRMRVMMSYNGWAYPCDTFQNGEVEDYSVTISEPVINYCESEGNYSNQVWINKVILKDIHNLSGNNGGYADFTDQVTDLWPNSYSRITLKPGFSGYAYREYWKVWVDWNQDGDFDDWGELEVAASSYGNIYRNITVPSYALPGETRMRVSMKHGGWPSSCEDFTFGEVEDYTIFVGNLGLSSQQPPNNGEDLNLTVTTKGNQVELDWINNTGVHNDFFVVEKSTDGQNFEMMTTVENQKSDLIMRNYSTIDTEPVKGINYYRIQLIMKDGRERYSEIQSVKVSEDPNIISVFPNPATDRVNINLSAYSGMDAKIMIVNNFGKVVHHEEIEKVRKTIHQIDLINISAGHYTISILVEGKKQIAKPLVILRL